MEEGGELEFEGGRTSDMDVRSQRSHASAKSRQSAAASVTKSQRSAMSKTSKGPTDRATVYKETPSGNTKKGRQPEDYQNISISAFSMVALSFVPPLCRTSYQKALARLLKKAESKLHRELNIGPLLKTVRDSNNIQKSLCSSKSF